VSGGGGRGRRRVDPPRGCPPRHRLVRGGGVGDGDTEPLVDAVVLDLGWLAVAGDADATAVGQRSSPPDRPASRGTTREPPRLDRRRLPVSPLPGRRLRRRAYCSASGIVAAADAVMEGSPSPKATFRASTGPHADRAAWSARRRDLDEG